MNTSWQLHIGNSIGGVYEDIVIHRMLADGSEEILRINPDGSTFSEKLGADGAYGVPTLKLHSRESRDVIAAFIAHGRKLGFKESTEALAEGKLMATERHLADMRQLLKLK